MVKQSIDERRQAVRAKRILSIQFRLFKSRVKDADRRWHLSTTHDMSYLGLTFHSDVPYHVYDILELHVVMSGILDIYKGYAKIMRIERNERGAFYLIAVKFVRRLMRVRKQKSPSVTKRSRVKKAVKAK